jgi:hypothetical protein
VLACLPVLCMALLSFTRHAGGAPVREFIARPAFFTAAVTGRWPLAL